VRVVAEDGANSAEVLDTIDRQPENGDVAVAGRQKDTHMGFVRVLATILFIIALPVAIVTTNIRLLANSPWTYDYAFDRYDAEESTGLSREDLDSTASALRDYWNNGEEIFFHTVTEDGIERPVFNARETLHLADVKDLFVTVNRLQELSAIYLLAYVVAFFIWARDGSLRQLAAQSLAGLALGAVVIGGIGIVAALGFEAAFERFHTIAFANDLWQLDPETDHLIQMFPEPFWRDMTIVLGVMCAVQALLIAVFAGVYLLGSRNERRELSSSVEITPSSPQVA
jgi:integral membrane protein (TIGR01906 family)